MLKFFKKSLFWQLEYQYRIAALQIYRRNMSRRRKMFGQNDSDNVVTGNNIPIRTIYVTPIMADVGEILENISLK